MIEQSDTGQTVEYRGAALGKFPRGVEHVRMTLVSVSGDSAFLESQGGQLFGVLAKDCSRSRHTPNANPAPPESDIALDWRASDLRALKAIDAFNKALGHPPIIPSLPETSPAFAPRLLALRQRAATAAQDAQAMAGTPLSAPDPIPTRAPSHPASSDPDRFVALPMPKSVPDWRVEPVQDRHKSIRGACADSRRNTP